MRICIVGAGAIGGLVGARLAAAGETIAGGVHSPGDQTGDSRKFADRLAAWSTGRLGVKFLYATTVEGLDIEAGRVRAVVTSAGKLAGDGFVIAMGPESGLLGRRYGIDLPIYPVKGYTATMPVENEETAPTMGGVDEDRLIAYSRLGNRLRLASTAEFAGFDRTFRPADFDSMVPGRRRAVSGRFR